MTATETLTRRQRKSMPKPEPSEWGKLSAGQSFEMLASDVRRAIFAAGWGRYEMLLVGLLIEESWGSVRFKGRDGWPDPKHCRINLSALAKELGVIPQRLYEARDSLVAKRFAVEDEDGLWINKNAHEWVDATGKKPLLDPRWLAFAMRARSRKTPKVHSRSTVNADPELHSRSGVNGEDVHSRSTGTAFTEIRQVHSRKSVNADSPSPGPPIEERTRIGELRETDRLVVDDDTREPFESGPDETPPEPMPRLWMTMPEEFRNDMVEAREYALTNLADRGGAEIAAEMALHPRPVKDMPGWWWLSALYSLVSAKQVTNPTAYVCRVLLNFCKDAKEGKEPTRPVAPPPSANGAAAARRPTPEELEAADRAFAERCKARAARKGVDRGR